MGGEGLEEDWSTTLSKWRIKLKMYNFHKISEEAQNRNFRLLFKKKNKQTNKTKQRTLKPQETKSSQGTALGFSKLAFS